MATNVDPRPLRLLSYLAPSLPEGLFRLVAETVGRMARRPVEVEFETRVSGPTPDSDPFAAGRADLAFACGPSYALLRGAGAPVEILAAAPVFDDPRNEGSPVYFSDIVVPKDHPAKSLEDLRGGAWVYNDRESLSGWLRMIERLSALRLGAPETFFSKVEASGAHIRSIAMVASGEASVSAVDSNALLLAFRRDPGLASRLRVLESWGPTPIQPLLARSTLGPEVRAAVVEALLRMHADPVAGPRLADYAVLRFARADAASYENLVLNR